MPDRRSSARHEHAVDEGRLGSDGGQVGFDEWVGSVAEERSFGTVFDLSNPADFAALETDAFEVLSSSRRPILIDEAQLLHEYEAANHNSSRSAG